MDTIVLRVPFVFSDTIDSRAISTVGDYVVLENTLSPMAIATHGHGVNGVYTQIQFPDPTTLLIVPSPTVFDQKESPVSKAALIETVGQIFRRAAGKGSTHISWSSSVDSVEVLPSSVRVKFKRQPVNLFHSLALMDLALGAHPVVMAGKPHLGLKSIPGPYLLKDWSPRLIQLKADERFPVASRSNSIKYVNIEYRKPGVVGGTGSSETNATDAVVEYVYGHEVSNSDLKTILSAKDRNLLVRPNEWMVYFGFGEGSSPSARMYLRSLRSALHRRLSDRVPGQAAFGIQPSDRSGSLTQETPFRFDSKRPDTLEITTLDEWMDFPTWKIVVSRLEKEGVKFRTLPRSRFKEIFKSPAYLTMLGFSAADPVAHLELLSGAGRVSQSTLSRADLDALIEARDATQAAKLNLKFESKLAENIDIIPVWHFPSIIVEDSRLRRSATLWNEAGCLQAWAYEISN